MYSSTANETILMLETATDNVKRYIARVFDDTNLLQPDWNSTEIWKSILALVLAYITAAVTIVVVNTIIDSILLNNFAALSRDWCFAEQNQTRSRLARVQDVLLKGLFGVVLVMRWPGWMWYQLHLWECTLYGVAGFAAFEAALVVFLLVMNGFIWTAHRMAIVTGWAPHSISNSKVRFTEDALKTPPQREARFTAPGSVDMGRFLSRNRGDDGATSELSQNAIENRKFWTEVSKQGLFFANELNNGSDQTTVYQTITAKEENWDFSLEELRLQHYKDTGRYAASPTTPLSVIKDHTKTEEEAEGMEPSGRKLLPSWISGRSFRDSIFGSSVGTEKSRDTFGKSIDEGRYDSPVEDSVEQAMTPDLLTGSSLTRQFT